MYLGFQLVIKRIKLMTIKIKHSNRQFSYKGSFAELHPGNLQFLDLNNKFKIIPVTQYWSYIVFMLKNGFCTHLTH